MNVEEVKRLLRSAGLAIEDERRLGNDTGTQLRVSNGAVVNVYNKGSLNVQGKKVEQVKVILGVSSVAPATSETKPGGEVFVVYGHDEDILHELEAMLRRWGLEPLILSQLPSEGQTIIEKLENYTARVNFAVVLATPDDEGYRAGHLDEKAYRARQNVVLELGVVLAKLGRKKVAILLNQQENMERPSDIQGLIYIPFKDNLVKEAGVLLAKEMAAQGYQIDIKRL